jgi:hypothetical protein
MNGTIEGGEGRDRIQGAPSTAQDTETAGKLPQKVALSNSNQRRNYAEAVHGSKGKTFKLTIKSREAQPPEKIIQIKKNQPGKN